MGIEKFIQEMLNLLQKAKLHYSKKNKANENSHKIESSTLANNRKSKIGKIPHRNRIRGTKEYLKKQIAKMEIQRLETLLTSENKLKESVWRDLEKYKNF